MRGVTAKRDPKIAKRIRRGEPAAEVATRYDLTPRHVRRVAVAAGADPARPGRRPTGAATHHTARGRALLARLVAAAAARGIEPEAAIDEMEKR